MNELQSAVLSVSMVSQCGSGKGGSVGERPVGFFSVGETDIIFSTYSMNIQRINSQVVGMHF